MPLRRLRPMTAAAAIAVTAAALTACAPSAAPTPTPTPHFTSASQAFKAAEDTYRAYIDALDSVDLKNPATFERAYKWTTGTANASDKKTLTALSSEGASLRGRSQITLIDSTKAATDSYISLAVCLDVSKIEIVGKDGNSIVDRNRSDIQPLTVSFRRSDSSPTNLLVSSIAGRSGEPKCP